jgi:hypothetical protein
MISLKLNQRVERKQGFGVSGATPKNKADKKSDELRSAPSAAMLAALTCRVPHEEFHEGFGNSLALTQRLQTAGHEAVASSA